MYIYKLIITGSLGLKIVFFASLISFTIILAIFLRRISIFNTLSQVINDIDAKFVKKEAIRDIYLYEKERANLINNPISMIIVSSFEEFDKKTSYNIIETKLLRIKNIISRAENDIFEFLNKFQKVLFHICAISPLVGIFFILFSFSDLFLNIGLNGDRDYNFIASQIGEILFIGILTILNSLVAFSVYVFLNYKSLHVLKKINNFALFIFNVLSFELESNNPESIIEKYSQNQFKHNEFLTKKDNSKESEGILEEDEDDGNEDGGMETEEEDSEEVELKEKQFATIPANNSVVKNNNKFEDDDDIV